MNKLWFGIGVLVLVALVSLAAWKVPEEGTLGAFSTTQPERTMLDSSSTAGFVTSSRFSVYNFHRMTFSVGFNASSGTIQFMGSTQEDVDFNAAQSITNRWDFLDITDLEDGSSTDGDTGLAPANATAVGLFRPTYENVNLKYVGVLFNNTHITGIGTTTITMLPATE